VVVLLAITNTATISGAIITNLSGTLLNFSNGTIDNLITNIIISQ
jgi:hypothetical protein